MFKTIYHVTNGPAAMYEIDARHALAKFPEEWRETEGEANSLPKTSKGGLVARQAHVAVGRELDRPANCHAIRHQ